MCLYVYMYVYTHLYTVCVWNFSSVYCVLRVCTCMCVHACVHVCVYRCATDIPRTCIRDQLVVSLIELMDMLLKHEGVDLKIITYRVTATSHDQVM